MFEKKYKEWTGTRDDLVKVLKQIEDHTPTKFALFSKSSGKRLDLKKTRIQRLIELGVIPGPIFAAEKSTKNAIYNWLHILSYFSAIVARKAGYTFEQIPSLLNGYDEEKLLSFIKSTDQPFSKSKKQIEQKDLKNSKRKTEILKSLDRREGRALISDQKLIALTPWLHVHISKRQASRIGKEEAEILADIFKESLLSINSN